MVRSKQVIDKKKSSSSLAVCLESWFVIVIVIVEQLLNVIKAHLKIKNDGEMKILPWLFRWLRVDRPSMRRNGGGWTWNGRDGDATRRRRKRRESAVRRRTGSTEWSWGRSLSRRRQTGGKWRRGGGEKERTWPVWERLSAHWGIMKNLMSR